MGEDVGAPVRGHRRRQRHADLLPGRQQPDATFDIVASVRPVADQGRPRLRKGHQLHRDRHRRRSVRTRTASVDVTITVNNADEAGTVTLSKVQPIVGQEVTATLTDPDGSPVPTITWLWESSSEPERISGKSSTIAGDSDTTTWRRWPISMRAATCGPLPPTTDRIEGRARARQAWSHSIPWRQRRWGRTAPPVFDSRDWSDLHDVDENTPAGMDIGPNPSRPPTPRTITLTYTLDATGAEFFDIVPTTGQLQTKAALDYEDTDADNPYSVKVTATDTSGDTDYHHRPDRHLRQ